MKATFRPVYYLNAAVWLLITSPASVAEERSENLPAAQLSSPFTLIPSAYWSYRDFDYSAGSGGVSGNLNSLGIGLTGIYQQFYVNFSGEKNPSASQETTENLFSGVVDFDRTDWAISLGYAVNPSISTFIGYKYGETGMTDLGPADPTIPPELVERDISLEGRGLFIGAGGGWAVRDWGFFSFSAAFADMTSVYKDADVDHSKGSAAGTSLTVKWQGPIRNNLSYNINLIRHDYYYDDFDKFETEISEEILSLRLGIDYRFK